MERERRVNTTGRAPGGKTPAAIQEPVVPLGALQQFLAAIRARDFEGAKALAFQILTDEPNNSTVLASLPQIDRMIKLQEEYREEKDVDADADGSDEEDDGEEDSGDSESGEEDGEEDGEEVGEEAEPSLAEIERSNAKRLQQLMLPERDAELRCSLRGLVNDLVP